MKYKYGIFLLSFSTIIWSASHQPQIFLEKISGTKTEGQMIVKHYCANCHAPDPLIALGAPRVGYQSDWLSRLKQGKKLLFQHTAEGIRAMPARGGCFECSDQQLELAIEILIQSNDPDFDNH